MTLPRVILGLCLALSAGAPARAHGIDDAEFRLCDESKLYRIDDALLDSDETRSLPIAEVAPKPKATAEELQRLFDEKLVLGPDAANVFVRVHVEFVVNCHGRIGGVRALSRAAPEIAAAIVKEVAALSAWEPGKAAGDAVDTLTKLTFTVSRGRAKVSLK
jgi:hypothetical protein